MSSGQPFSFLDEASGKTFLCGTTVLIQKYIFDGGAGKIGLETKNIVACTSFVVEQKLVSFFPFLCLGSIISKLLIIIKHTSALVLHSPKLFLEHRCSD